MKFNLFVVGLVFACVCTDETVALYPRSYTDSEYSRKIGSTKKRLRKYSENDIHSSEKYRRLDDEEKSGEVSEKETVAVEQLLSLCRNEISQQSKSSDCEKEEVIRARSDFLAAVRNILLCRQAISRTYTRAMRLGEIMSRCRQELHILENDIKIFEQDQERAKQDAIERFFQLKKAQERAKL
ncbi:MAG: hypothetical protein J5821_04275 [Alphaproteobacteria bacterium]|nr:hypothetical protein [Alphaproteobacteria bacterium]